MLVCAILMFSGCANVNDAVSGIDYEDNSGYPWLMREEICFDMSYGEVREQLNGVSLLELDNGFGFDHNEKYRNCDVSELYLFEEGLLKHITYWFRNCEITDDEITKNGYFGLYTELKTMFEDYYGEMTICNEGWVNEECKGIKELHEAIKDGDYTALTVWDLGDFYCAITMDASQTEGLSVMYYKK